MTSIGRMRYRVALQSPTNTRDAGGGVSQSYKTINTIWADIVPQKGSETYRQGKTTEKITHKITIRKLPNVNTRNRISYDSRLFAIKNVINLDERGRFLQLLCEEGVAIWVILA